MAYYRFLLVCSLYISALTRRDVNGEGNKYSKQYQWTKVLTDNTNNESILSTSQFEEFNRKSLLMEASSVPALNFTKLPSNSSEHDDYLFVNDFLPTTTLENKQKKYQIMEEGTFCRRKFDGHAGYCILAYQCLHVIREYRLHGVKIDICTYRRNIPVICCPLAEKHTEDQRISLRKCQEYHAAARGIKVDVGLSFSNKLCVPSVPLIVGGTITRKTEYPHMAALGWTQEDKSITWGCSGSLLSHRFVLTAAHCTTTGIKAPDVVRLGVWNLNRSSSKPVDRKILLIYVHPKYRSSSYYHDIALLKLVKGVKFSENIRPICVWQMVELNFPKAVAVGWGRTEFLGPKSDVLRKVDLNIINQTICQRVYKGEHRLPNGLIDEQLCAGIMEGGKDTCQGDSGGPLIVELPEFNCVKFIIGITSFGRFCASPNAPSIYTKVYSYLDWIEQIAFSK